ncbi:EamA family transporter, partial [Singulisphaera rosea]
GSVTVGFRGMRDLDPVWLSAFSNLAGAIALGVWILVSRGSIPIPSATQGLGLVGFGLIQMAIPYIFFARGLRTIDAPEASLITLVEPILNPIWVLLVAGERPAGATIVGGLLLLSGVAWRYLPALNGRSDETETVTKSKTS